MYARKHVGYIVLAHRIGKRILMTNRNPQASQMADQSMIRTLAAQLRCIWPQEHLLFERYGTPQNILDVGCGTGECTIKLAERYPQAQILGVELDPNHVERARNTCRRFGPRVRIEQGDAYALAVPAETIDLVVCRHLLQSIPYPEKVIQECQKVLRWDGWLHLLLEDYTMIHIEGPPKFDRFWIDGSVAFGLDTDCDLRIGRRGISLLHGFAETMLDYIVVDTERVERKDFIDMVTAWRDGYSEVLAPYLQWTTDEVIDLWNEMIEAIEVGYALWQVPIASGKKVK
jgi:SAM-dependent methyltransferase